MTRQTAEIVERKGQLCVRISDGYGRGYMWATKDEQGRIRYDQPERIARTVKQVVVPRLFKEIDRRNLGG